MRLLPLVIGEIRDEGAAIAWYVRCQFCSRTPRKVLCRVSKEVMDVPQANTY
jgi:hypothetical protein